MTLEAFTGSIKDRQPPNDLSVYLQALWYDAHGDWERSHTLIQDVEDSRAARIHAYLHRKEGDIGNARYWYARAGLKPASASLAEEWEAIVREMLESGNR